MADEVRVDRLICPLEVRLLELSALFSNARVSEEKLAALLNDGWSVLCATASQSGMSSPGVIYTLVREKQG